MKLLTTKSVVKMLTVLVVSSITDVVSGHGGTENARYPRRNMEHGPYQSNSHGEPEASGMSPGQIAGAVVICVIILAILCGSALSLSNHGPTGCEGNCERCCCNESRCCHKS